ncbi:TPA: hypothetical protein N0F65_012619 [Lagenidium giganteum]|uniref:Acid phosphatase n=1 Tax=Lagenidium giganteum TaxID=4803 RepID=A0AAV2YRF0_9STRA|nr:TPA: hypothetical protein N0F65_012619 [Lagenidium giganteum]
MVLTRLGALLCGVIAILAHASILVRASSHDSELVLLVSLSRHGSRAPNPTAIKLCPNNYRNLKSYHVPPEQLTERGMQQLETTGRHIRQIYVDQKKFLTPSFNGEDHKAFEAYFRADAANRCGQSAISLGYGLYPDGTGPLGYAKQPIPVYMQLAENERDFTANGPCWGVMNHDLVEYSQNQGKTLIEEHAQLLSQVGEVCGTSFYDNSGVENPVLAIKDVADMFLFDRDEGLPMTPGLTPTMVDNMAQLSFQQLIERLYSTPQQRTVTIGGFPLLLLRNLNEGANPNRDPEKATKYYSYHGHRELLHGLGFMIGMKFHFDGLPSFNGSTPLHPGTTLFFELHRRKDDDGQLQHFLRLFVWSPQSQRQAITLENCETDCPLETFNSFIQNHLAATGQWQQLCNYHPTLEMEAFRFDTVRAPALRSIQHETTSASSYSTSPSTLVWLLHSSICAMLGAAAVVLVQRIRRRWSYQPIE